MRIESHREECGVETRKKDCSLSKYSGRNGRPITTTYLEANEDYYQ